MASKPGVLISSSRITTPYVCPRCRQSALYKPLAIKGHAAGPRSDALLPRARFHSASRHSDRHMSDDVYLRRHFSQGKKPKTWHAVSYPRPAYDAKRTATHGSISIISPQRTPEAKRAIDCRAQRVRPFHTSSVSPAKDRTVAESTRLPADRREGSTGIRSRLRHWQREFDAATTGLAERAWPVSAASGPMSNSLAARDETNDDYDGEDLSSITQSEDDYAGLLTSQRVGEGDLVAMGSSHDYHILLKVRHFSKGSIYLSTSGSFVRATDSRAYYRIPRWADSALLKALDPFIPNVEVAEFGKPVVDQNGGLKPLKAAPRFASGPLITRMQSFSREVDRIYQENAELLDNFHTRLSHKQDLRFGSLRSVSEALLRLSPNAAGDEAQLATLRALLHGDHRVAIHPNTVRTSGYLQIKSLAEAKATSSVIDDIRAWLKFRIQGSTLSDSAARNYRKMNLGPIDRFLEKAIEIVKRSRHTRPLMAGNLGLSTQQFAMQPDKTSVSVYDQNPFNSSDQKIIVFLKNWACELRTVSETNASLAAILLEATGLYGDVHEGNKQRTLGYLFLQEIGVALPYHASRSEDRHLLLPGTGHSTALDGLMKRTESEEPLSDGLQHLRHDWGHLRVFCIDSESTTDLDDGLSVTPGPNGDTWVHVHIANPTAYLSQDSAITTRARHMVESIYTPLERISMLPSWPSREYWSLAPGRTCLTFSMLVDGKDGHIITTEIRPGIVRNVIRMTPEEVSTCLDPAYRAPASFSFRLGTMQEPDKDRSGQKAQISAEAINELSMLDRIAELRLSHRLRSGAQEADFRVNVSAAVHTGMMDGDSPHAGFRATTARRTMGDPVIDLEFHGQQDWDSPINDMSPGSKLVMEAMMLACEGAGQWASSRDVPLIYRGVKGLSEEARAHFWHEVCEPAIEKYGALPEPLRKRYLGMWSEGGSMLGTRPLKHAPLGVQGYARVTSPLRRFTDMLNHWQIQAVLQKEASQGGQALEEHDAPLPAKVEPHTDETLQALANSIAPRELQIKRYMADMRQWWVVMAFFRAFYYKEAALPAVFTGQVVVDGRLGLPKPVSVAQLFSYGVDCEFDHADVDMQAGDVCEFAIESVDVCQAKIKLKWLKLVKRFEV